MRYRRDDVVARAIEVLDAHGLDALSMRRLAGDLGVQPGALYHHFTNKDALLAAIADEILRRGRRPAEIMAWDAEVQLLCLGLRDAMRRHRDGAVLIARVNRADAEGLERPLRAALERAGADTGLARIAARTLLRYVLSHEDDSDSDFALGLELVLDGLRRRLSPSA
ncbi:MULTISPECIES: TetR family transcriptional regulator [unclassified Nocardioides]|uniref:TetR family transcriptional regulator n=1 Tax=unclassified Nocardioides TaxID=2615069 RepID=UPI00115207A8|nr:MULTISPECIES: TetR family transcriptional regulator [unclassified Nocardioides]TQK72137.1 TetR family transcriptional regulator [Nocardioides sp. SLBN-35]WGY03646.1 TetR family transcriptional regulator [Nocardioides sp. QY071]